MLDIMHKIVNQVKCLLDIGHIRLSGNMSRTVSWKWGGKTYKGTVIRTTKTHIYARTHNGKTKKIKKK